MDPEVWGPTYWRFLHTVAAHYPVKPTTTEKKIHYRLIHNFHEFIPHRIIAADFRHLLEKNPVTPYLDSQADFVRWVNHMHNLVNTKLDKPTVSLKDHLQAFQELHESVPDKRRRFLKNRYWIVCGTFILLLGLVVHMYQK
jgi:hypothetical protein